jgi:DNA-binding response OmpR family regulator
MQKILVVNNDIDTMTLLKGWLERKNYEVEYTSSHDQVAGIIKKFEPGIVLVDVMQKQVAEQIKGDEETSSVPVILMTGYALREKNNLLPVDDIIEKPFNLPLLQKKIEKHIRKI